MERKFKITVDGMPYIVTVEEMPQDEGQLYPAQAIAMTPAAPAPVARPAPAAPAAAAAAKATTAKAASPDDRVSPLSGVVESIAVQVGAEVAEGDRLLTIEAMKMKTAVTAHKAGKVAAVLVAAGDAVGAGQPLVTIRAA